MPMLCTSTQNSRAAFSSAQCDKVLSRYDRLACSPNIGYGTRSGRKASPEVLARADRFRDSLGPVTRAECVSHGNFESSASICRKFLFPPFPSCRPRIDQYYGLGRRRGYGLNRLGTWRVLSSFLNSNQASCVFSL